MFATLRYDVDTVRVTSTHPAYQRLKRYACKNCHSKKLRCTREQDGCRRCLSKSLKCEYERDSHRRSGRSNGSINQSITVDPVSAAALSEEHIGRTTTCAQPASSAITAPVSAGISSPGISVDSNTVFDFLNYNLGEPINGFSAADFAPRSSGADQGFSAQTGIVDSRRETTPQFRDPFFFFEGTSQISLTNSPPPPSTTSPVKEHSPISCECIASAITLLEVISIEHIEATLQSVPKVLCHSKDALNQCRALLRCDHCSNTSGFLMLLVIICQKLTSLYQCTLLILTEQFFKLHSPDQRDGAHIAHLAASRDRDTDRSLNVREYDVDVEEEPCVFGGVVQMQLKKMVAFLAILKALLAASNWSSHLVMVQTVRDQVQDLLRKCSTSCAGIECGQVL